MWGVCFFEKQRFSLPAQKIHYCLGQASPAVSVCALTCKNADKMMRIFLAVRIMPYSKLDKAGKDVVVLVYCRGSQGTLERTKSILITLFIVIVTENRSCCLYDWLLQNILPPPTWHLALTISPCGSNLEPYEHSRAWMIVLCKVLLYLNSGSVLKKE